MQREIRQLLSYIIVFLFGVVVAGGGIAFSNRVQPAAIVITPVLIPTLAPTATQAPIRVHVSGAIASPAVYDLPAGSIVEDAVEAAGGFMADADTIRLNLAQPLADGMQVHVPWQREEAAEPEPPLIREPMPTATAAPTLAATPAGPVNINTASQAELETLPRIGPSLAQRIIDYREANGPFVTIEEIQEVAGIGETTFAQLESMITVIDTP